MWKFYGGKLLVRVAACDFILSKGSTVALSYFLTGGCSLWFYTEQRSTVALSYFLTGGCSLWFYTEQRFNSDMLQNHAKFSSFLGTWALCGRLESHIIGLYQWALISEHIHGGYWTCIILDHIKYGRHMGYQPWLYNLPLWLRTTCGLALPELWL